MEDLLKQELDTSVLEVAGRGGAGAICQGVGYRTDQGMVFVKTNKEPGARLMFNGEFESLQALYNADEVRVPKPIKVLDNPDGGAMLVIEYFDMSHLSSYAAMLGQQMASLHKKNSDIGKQMKKDESSIHRFPDLVYVDKFGFDVVTCCGYIPQCNEWTDSWVNFYAQKMEEQIRALEAKYGDRRVRDLWSQLLPNLPKLFDGLDIQPALLHGDLNAKNVGQLSDGPVIYDPACFYGHAEFDLSMSILFGGIDPAFYDSYYKVLPKQPGYESRLKLYFLYHNINHWNHFAGDYEGASLKLLRSLVQERTKH